MDFLLLEEANSASIIGGARAQCVDLLEMYGFEPHVGLLGAEMLTGSSSPLSKWQVGTGRPLVLFPVIFGRLS